MYNYILDLVMQNAAQGGGERMKVRAICKCRKVPWDAEKVYRDKGKELLYIRAFYWWINNSFYAIWDWWSKACFRVVISWEKQRFLSCDQSLLNRESMTESMWSVIEEARTVFGWSTESSKPHCSILAMSVNCYSKLGNCMCIYRGKEPPEIH